MGTALTEEQIAAIGRLATTVVVVFDGDTAGQRAAQKAIPLFVDAASWADASRGCPRASTPTTSCASPTAAPTPSGGSSRAPGRCSTSSSRTRLGRQRPGPRHGAAGDHRAAGEGEGFDDP
jgi:hypothetical protein